MAELGHKYELEKTIPATHLNEGEKIYTCFCGDSYSKSIDKLPGHTFEKEITPPTCTKVGYTTYYCECGEKYEANYVAELGHNYIPEVTQEPTHLECGIETYTCDCGDSYKKEIPNIKEHSYEKMVTPPTCTEGGYTIYYCDCGDSYEEEISAIGHKEFVYVVGIEPTCTETGVTDCIACEVCETILVESEILLALGHEKVSDGYKAPTCTEDGLSELVHCSRCDYVFMGQNTIPAEHKWELDEAESKEVICEEDGYYRYRCSGCEEIKEEFKEAYGHYDNGMWETVEEATCTTDGLKMCNCKVCGVEMFETIPSFGEHIWNDWIVETQATCENEGLEVIACKDCGIIKEERITEKLPHDYKNGWQNLIEPTCTENGLSIQICRNCLNIQTQTLFAKGHNVIVLEEVKGSCDVEGMTQGEFCSECGFIFKEQVSVGFIHNEVISKPAIAPTCDKIGYTAEICCDICKVIIKKQQEIASFGHNWERKVRVAPTCVTAGEIDVYCLNCGKNYIEKIEKLPHTEYVIAAKAPTCIAAGSTSYIKCKVCDCYITKPETVPATGNHSFEVLGNKKVCSVCNYTELINSGTVSLDVTGFRLASATLNSYSFTWDVCKDADGYEIVRVDPYTGDLVMFASDLKDVGFTIYDNSPCWYHVRAYCYLDGKKITGEFSEAVYGAYLPKAPLDMRIYNQCGNVVVGWDKCDAIGYEVYQKTRDGKYIYALTVMGNFADTTISGLVNGETYSFKVRAFIGDYENRFYGSFGEVVTLVYDADKDHKLGEWTTKYAPNCCEEGVEAAKCLDCGKEISRAIAKIPHNEIVVSPYVAATCTESGHTEKTECSICKVLIKTSETLPELGHDYKYVVINEATCTTDGNKFGLCLRCSAQEIVTISATGHNFEGSKCKNCDYNKADFCSCNCHKGGISGLIWKLLVFFYKIFGSNKDCACGATHY